MFVNNIPSTLVVGSFEVHYYSLFFAFGVILNYLILEKLWKKNGWSPKILDSAVIYLFFGLVIGARLGEVFFYNPEYYLSDPVKILKISEGGLSSHGATIGLIVAYVMFLLKEKHKKHGGLKENFLKYADVLALPMPLTAALVRIGNFFNSEIVGRATDSPLGVVFAKNGENFARHPAQLYEGALLMFIFIILSLTFLRKRRPNGLILFLFIGLYFLGRFFLEFFKEYQTDMESLLPWDLTMGQALSIIPVLIALGYFIYIFARFARVNCARRKRA